MAKSKKDTIIDRYAQGMFVRQDIYASRVKSLYDDAVEKLLLLAQQIPDLDSGKKFNFSDNPRIGEEATKIIRELYSRVYNEVKNGCTAEWELANQSCDKMIQSAFGWKLKDRNLCARWWDRNQSAVDQFFARKSRNGGMNLSQRVWKYTGDLRTEMENCITVSLGEANTAQEMSRKVRKYLQYPDKLFRRVRGSDGKLHLSAAAKAFHPSRGVYRSSYKNAMRLTRTETNAAYRAADEDRWQRMDFVLGYEVKTSNNHPDPDICDDLKGKYPKEFKFTAWHPHCRCYVVPILAKEEEMIAMQKAILDGKNPKSVKVEKPEFDGLQNLSGWVTTNADRIRAAATKPYFIADNFKHGDIDKGLKFDISRKTIGELAEERHAKDRSAIADKWHDRKRQEIINRVSKYDIEIDHALQGRIDALEDAFKSGDSESIQKAFERALRGIETQKKWDDIVWDGFSPDQKENLRKLGNQIGVKKGRRMTHEQANSGHVNPLYKKNDTYAINCQTCAPVYALRRMGFNIEAKGNPNLTKRIVDTHFHYMSTHCSEFWKRPDGQILTWDKVRHTTKLRTMTDWLDNQPDGVFQIQCVWKGGKSGHTFNYVKEGGKGHFYDPQTNRLFKDLNDFREYSDDVSPKYGWSYWKVDHRGVNISRVTELIQPHTNDVFFDRKSRIKQIADARHATRDSQKIQELWTQRRIDLVQKQIQTIIDPVKGVQSDALEKRVNNVINAVKAKRSAAEIQKQIDRVQSGVESLQYAEKRRLERERIIGKTAGNVLKVAKETPEIDFSRLERLIDARDFTAMQQETKTIARQISEMKKRENALADVIPDVRNWHKKFTIAELENSKTQIQRTFRRWSWDFNNLGDLDNLVDKLTYEISWMETKGRKYSTWEIARDAYREKLTLVKHRRDMLAVKDKILLQMDALKKSRSKQAKDLVAEFDDLFKNDKTTLTTLQKKANDIQSKFDALEKRKAKSGKITPASSGEYVPKSDDEVRKEFVDYMKTLGKNVLPKHVDVRDGFVQLGIGDHQTIYNVLKPESIAEHKQLWNHHDSASRWGAAGYVQTGNSFKINGDFRATKVFGDLDSKMISALQGHGATNDDIKTIKLLDKKIGEFSLPIPIRVTRYVQPPALQCIFGENFGGLPRSIVANMSKKSNLVIATDPAYLSASTNELYNVFKRYEVKLEIEVPPNTPMYLTDNYMESEAVFGRATKMKYLGVKLENNKAVIRCRMIR